LAYKKQKYAVGTKKREENPLKKEGEMCKGALPVCQPLHGKSRGVPLFVKGKYDKKNRKRFKQFGTAKPGSRTTNEGKVVTSLV